MVVMQIWFITMQISSYFRHIISRDLEMKYDLLSMNTRFNEDSADFITDVRDGFIPDL